MKTQVVKDGLRDLRTVLTSFNSFYNRKGSYYKHFSTFCEETKTSLAIDTPDKVTDFYEWLIKDAKPTKHTNIAAHTAINHMQQVSKR